MWLGALWRKGACVRKSVPSDPAEGESKDTEPGGAGREPGAGGGAQASRALNQPEASASLPPPHSWEKGRIWWS